MAPSVFCFSWYHMLTIAEPSCPSLPAELESEGNGTSSCRLVPRFSHLGGTKSWDQPAVFALKILEF